MARQQGTYSLRSPQSLGCQMTARDLLQDTRHSLSRTCACPHPPRFDRQELVAACRCCLGPTRQSLDTHPPPWSHTITGSFSAPFSAFTGAYTLRLRPVSTTPSGYTATVRHCQSPPSQLFAKGETIQSRGQFGGHAKARCNSSPEQGGGQRHGRTRARTVLRNGGWLRDDLVVGRLRTHGAVELGIANSFPRAKGPGWLPSEVSHRCLPKLNPCVQPSRVWGQVLTRHEFFGQGKSAHPKMSGFQGECSTSGRTRACIVEHCRAV